MINTFVSFVNWSIIAASIYTLLAWLCIPHLMLWTKARKLSNQLKLPPGPATWGPIVGNLPQFRNSFGRPHIRAQELARIYGPVMTIKFGFKRLIFISDPHVAERCFRANDSNFANRPFIAAERYLLYGGDHPSLAPIGDYWRCARKLYTTELLSTKKIHQFQVVRSEELTQTVREIYDASMRGESINLHDTFLKLFTNVITRMTMSRRFFNSPPKFSRRSQPQSVRSNGKLDDSLGQEWQLLIDSNHELMTKLLLEDVSPALAWIDRLTGIRARMQDNFNRMDKLLQSVLDDHVEELSSRVKTPESSDFTDVLLMLRNNGSSKTEFITDRTIKAFSLDTVGAASETSAVTSEWAVSELLTNPEVMTKAQKEVDSVVGKDRCVRESDLPNMPYIRALVAETLRLHPPLPWLVPHMNLEDCKIEGYDIPANSILMFQVWAMGREPSLWENPLKFDPDRFLGSDFDVRSVHTGFMPFGSGRRMCPGYNLGLTILQYTVARLIHSFDWSLPNPRAPLDMTEKFGLTSLKRASELQAQTSPRLPPDVYSMTT